MSFLNALASNGLTVGLRFYQTGLNNRGEAAAALGSASPLDNADGAAQAQPESPPKVAAQNRPLPQSPEEVAAGRVEAKAKLAEDGSLGRLQAVDSAGPAEGEAASVAAQSGPGGAEAAATAAGAAGMAMAAGAAGAAPPTKGDRPLTAEEQREVARLKMREAEIKAQSESSDSSGVRYSYTMGPDDNRYVSGVMGGQGQTGPDQESDPGSESGSGDGPGKPTGDEAEQAQKMKDRDREVRTHEQAHLAASAGLGSAPVYEYQTGPDGRRYAVGGHVNLRTSGSSDPDQALREAETVKRAATAPAEPSGTDRAVAASATADINRIKAEKAAKKSEDAESGDGSGDQAIKPELGNFLSGSGPAVLKQDGEANAAGPRQFFNGSSLSQQAVGAYAAIKFGGAVDRPVLARA